MFCLDSYGLPKNASNGGKDSQFAVTLILVEQVFFLEYCIRGFDSVYFVVMVMLPYFSSEYRELHDYIDSIKRVNLRFTLTRLNRSLWKSRGAVLPGGVFVQSVWGGAGAAVQAETPSDGVNILVHHTGKFVGMGEEMKPGDGLIMPPGSTVFTHTPGEYCCYTVFIPTDLLKSMDSLRFLINEDRKKASIVHSDHVSSVSVCEMFGDLFAGFDDVPGVLPNEDSLVCFRDKLFDTLGVNYGNLIDASTRGRGRSLLANEDTLGRAVDVVENKKQRKVMMADLVEAANVSETSLRAAFKRYLGLSPSEYIRLRKFNLIWQELDSSRAEDTTVARIVADYRIWDMGRFANRFRRIFGENPSVTLKRAK